MKTIYTAPESQLIKLSFELTILSGENQHTGGNSGSNMDDPEYQNPFSGGSYE